MAHSFGALVTLHAMRKAPGSPNIVTIAGVSDFRHVFEAFRDGLGLDSRMSERLRHRVGRDMFPGVADLWSQFDSARDASEGPGRLLVLHSTDDPRVPVAAAHRLSEVFAGRVTTSIMDGLGHHRIMSDPTVVLRVMDFLSESPVAQPPWPAIASQS